MTQLDAASQMEFGDEAALRSFFLDHATLHQTYAQSIFAKFSKQMPLVDLNDEQAIVEFVQLMQGGMDVANAEHLQAWLTLHQDLHTAELSALGTQYSDDLQSVDFSDPDQFESWFYDHQLTHDAQDTALGI